MSSEAENWDIIIKPGSKWFDIRLKELWKYRDLLFLFVKRDFVSVYKQTILGPLWFIIQPVITTIIFTLIFHRVAKVQTDNVPPFLFYLAGITLWTYFGDCLSKTANTFMTNANLFGKVYFPRLIMPLAVLFSNLIKLGIQFLLFLSVWIYFLFSEDSAEIQPNMNLFVLPLLIVVMAGLGMGFGTIISALTTKYRDLHFLVGFGVQLLMYASPIVYPLSEVPEEFKNLILLNPVTPVIEAFKFSFLGVGYFSWFYLLYSFVFMVFLLLVGVLLFNKVQKSFIDTF